MAQLSGTKWEFALNTERQLNVKTATVHGKVNKVNSPLLHFELIDRGNNLLYHSLVSLLKSWPWNRWSDEGKARDWRTRSTQKQKQSKKTCSWTVHNITRQARSTACTHIQKHIQYKHTKTLKSITVTKVIRHEQCWIAANISTSHRWTRCSLQSQWCFSQCWVSEWVSGCLQLEYVECCYLSISNIK